MARIINGTQIQIHIDPDEDHKLDDQPRNPRSNWSRRSNSSNNKISAINKDEDQLNHHQIIKTQITTPTTRNLCSNLFLIFFIFQILFIIILTIFLTIHTFIITSHHHHHHSFHPLHFYPPLLTSSAFASLFAFFSQSSLTLFSSSSPSKPIKTAFCLAPLSTLSFAVLLLAIGSAGSFAAAALALVASLILALYSCWASPRTHHATNILSSALASTSTDHTSACTKALSITLLITTAYSFITVSALAGATASQLPIQKAFFFVILLSLAWTTHALKGLVHVQVARIAFHYFTTTTNDNNNRTSLVLSKECLGSVCVGAAVEPVIGVVRGVARAVGVVGGDRDEFMFSCVSCCGGVGGEVVWYGNRWGFVGVGVHGKGFVKASMEAWEMFERCEMVRLIDEDLTGSICFMWGVIGGSLCALLGGSWALAVDHRYATAVAIYAFLIGYLTARIGMAWPQACVSAYHVAYAENPESVRFDSTIPNRIQELQRSQDQY